MSNRCGTLEMMQQKERGGRKLLRGQRGETLIGASLLQAGQGRASEGSAGDYAAPCLGSGLLNEAVGWTTAEAAVGIALARAGVLPVQLGLRKGVGTTRTAVGARRLVLGVAMGVTLREGFQ